MTEKIWGTISLTADLIRQRENTQTLSHTNDSQGLKWKQKTFILKTITQEFKLITFNQLNGLKEGQAGTHNAERDISLWRGDTAIHLQGLKRKNKHQFLPVEQMKESMKCHACKIVNYW